MKKSTSTSTARAEELFSHVDMRETSLHVYVAKVDLHFTDDSASDKETCKLLKSSSELICAFSTPTRLGHRWRRCTSDSSQARR